MVKPLTSEKELTETLDDRSPRLNPSRKFEAEKGRCDKLSSSHSFLYAPSVGETEDDPAQS